MPSTDVLVLCAQNTPDKLAVVEAGKHVTFLELNRDVNRLANGLQQLGLRPGERAVWCGPNSYEVIVFQHVARKLGVTSVPLAYRFTSEEMQYVIDNSDATLVLTDSEQAPRIAAVRSQLPKVREIVVYRGDPFSGARAWDEVMAAGQDDEPEAIA